MSTVPSLKGSLITDLADDLRKLVAEGEISRSLYEQRLTPEDRATLESPISISEWYGVGFYVRCAELMRDAVGGGRNEFLYERGFAKGKRLMEAGLYQQMEYAARRRIDPNLDAEGRFKAYGRDIRLMVTLSRNLVNFTKWSVVPDPDHPLRYRIRVEEASDYPDVLVWGTEGLIESMSSSQGLDRMWRHRRVSKDCVEFQMTRDL